MPLHILKRLFFIIALLTPTLASSFELTVMLGEIEQVLIKGKKPRYEPGRIDHSCGQEIVTFIVQDYLRGEGEGRVELSRWLTDYNCQSSWRGIPPSPVLAMRTDHDNSSIFRGIVMLTNTSEGLYLVDDIDRFVYVANIHTREKADKNPIEDLISILPEPIVILETTHNGNKRYEYLKSIGILEYELVELDLNKNCISGCDGPNLVDRYKVKYIKGISIDKIRDYKF